jgi:putative ABC transport system permease protein
MRWLIDLGEALQIALGAIRANRARGALTTLGIIIGIVAVILTMTAVNGLQNRFRESFSAIGTDVIYVSRMPWIIMNDFFMYRNRPNIELREAEALEQRMRGKAIINPTMGTRREVKYRSETVEGVPIIGTTEKQIVVASGQPETGRFMMESDVTYKKNVCVIGEDIREGLFGTVSPINKKMKIGRSVFRVVGVMEKQGGSFADGPNFDRQIFIPITSYVKAFGGQHGREAVSIAVTGQYVQRYNGCGAHRRVAGDKHLSVRGWCGSDEHHVCVGHRAYARDRHPQGDRCQAAQYFTPVSF